MLRLLADRLGSTVENLQHGVDPEVTTLAVRYAQLALKDGEPAQALHHVEELLASDLTLPAGLASEAHLLRAQAREGLGQLDAAIEDLEILAANAASTGQWEVHMARVIDLVRCYQDAGDVAYALDLATEALDPTAWQDAMALLPTRARRDRQDTRALLLRRGPDAVPSGLRAS